jgi:hypothetical protein
MRVSSLGKGSGSIVDGLWGGWDRCEFFSFLFFLRRWCWSDEMWTYRFEFYMEQLRAGNGEWSNSVSGRTSLDTVPSME